MSRTSIVFGLIVVSLITARVAAAATPTGPHPSKQEIRALVLRGQALNKIYGADSSVGPTAQEVRALTERGQALNRMYHLGAYTNTTGSSFPWRSVELGIVGTVGAILVGFVAAVAVRRRHAAIPV